jgi:hypothetical protein
MEKPRPTAGIVTRYCGDRETLLTVKYTKAGANGEIQTHDLLFYEIEIGGFSSWPLMVLAPVSYLRDRPPRPTGTFLV